MSKLWLHHVCALKKEALICLMLHGTQQCAVVETLLADRWEDILMLPDTCMKWTSNQSAAGNYTLGLCFSVNQTVNCRLSPYMGRSPTTPLWIGGTTTMPLNSQYYILRNHNFFQQIILVWVLVALKLLQGQKDVFSLFLHRLRWTGTSTGVTIQGRKGYKSHRANSS